MSTNISVKTLLSHHLAPISPQINYITILTMSYYNNTHLKILQHHSS